MIVCVVSKKLAGIVVFCNCFVSDVLRE